MCSAFQLCHNCFFCRIKILFWRPKHQIANAAHFFKKINFLHWKTYILFTKDISKPYVFYMLLSFCRVGDEISRSDRFYLRQKSASYGLFESEFEFSAFRRYDVRLISFCYYSCKNIKRQHNFPSWRRYDLFNVFRDLRFNSFRYLNEWFIRKKVFFLNFRLHWK